MHICKSSIARAIWCTPGATPYLIDWESAGRLNPTYEIVQIALDWSGITTRFDNALCRGILSAYKAVGGVVDPAMLEAAVDCLRGEWLIWLVYNIARTVDPDTEQRALGQSQIDLVLPTLLHLEKFETGILYV